MKKTLALLTSLFLFPAAFAFSDIESLALFQTSLKKNAGTVWPGFNAGNHPMIITRAQDSRDELYAFDLLTQNNQWQKRILQGVPVNYMQHDSIGAHKFLNTYLNSIKLPPLLSIENQSAIVMPLMYSFADSKKSILEDDFNKKFMTFQYYLDYELYDSPNSSSKANFANKIGAAPMRFNSFNNPEIYSLLYLELAILRDYVNTQNLDLIKTYTAVHQYRTSLLDSASREFEINADNPLCMNYIYLKTRDLSGEPWAKNILNEYVNTLPAHLVSPNDGSINPDNFYYDYFRMLDVIYLIQQFALDKIEPAWKTVVEERNTPSTSLMIQHYSLSDSLAKTITEAAKTRYRYAEFLQKINAKLTPYRESMEQALYSWQNQDGVEIIFRRQGESWMFNMTPNAIHWRIDSNVMLSSNIAQLHIEDENLNFDARNMTSYMVDDAAYIIKFKLPLDTVLIADGNEPITLEKFMQSAKPLKINQLTLYGKGRNALYINLGIARTSGMMSVVNGNVEFNYSTE